MESNSNMFRLQIYQEERFIHCDCFIYPIYISISKGKEGISIMYKYTTKMTICSTCFLGQFPQYKNKDIVYTKQQKEKRFQDGLHFFLQNECEDIDLHFKVTELKAYKGDQYFEIQFEQNHQKTLEHIDKGQYICNENVISLKIGDKIQQNQEKRYIFEFGNLVLNILENRIYLK